MDGDKFIKIRTSNGGILAVRHDTEIGWTFKTVLNNRVRLYGPYNVRADSTVTEMVKEFEQAQEDARELDEAIVSSTSPENLQGKQLAAYLLLGSMVQAEANPHGS